MTQHRLLSWQFCLSSLVTWWKLKVEILQKVSIEITFGSASKTCLITWRLFSPGVNVSLSLSAFKKLRGKLDGSIMQGVLSSEGPSKVACCIRLWPRHKDHFGNVLIGKNFWRMIRDLKYPFQFQFRTQAAQGSSQWPFLGGFKWQIPGVFCDLYLGVYQKVTTGMKLAGQRIRTQPASHPNLLVAFPHLRWLQSFEGRTCRHVGGNTCNEINFQLSGQDEISDSKFMEKKYLPISWSQVEETLQSRIPKRNVNYVNILPGTITYSNF